jgi:predicted nucleic acid-binding protein
VAERWVVNASPIIVLAGSGQENLLLELADEVVVPRAVIREIEAGPLDLAQVFLRRAVLPIVETPVPNPALVAWDLGAGETAVISFALNNSGWTAILDDNAARKCARTFAIPLKGTLAVVLLAKVRGLIPSAADVLRQLQHNGFRLKDSVVREALLRTVGESW